MTDATVLDAPVPAGSASPQRAFRDMLVQLVARVANLGLGVVVTALVARTLGRDGYGQWLTILSTFQILGFFASLGLDQVAVRESAADPASANRWIGALLVARTALTLPSMILAAIVLLGVQESNAMLVAGLVLLAQFPLGVAGSLTIIFQLRLRNGLPMLVLTVNSILWAVCVLVIDLTGGALVALAVALVATSTLTSVWQAVAGLRILGSPLKPSRAALFTLVRIGAPLGLAGLLVNVYARIDQLIIYKAAGASDAGLYGAAYRVLDQSHFVPVSVLTTLAPVMASLWTTDRPRMLRVAGLAARLLSVGSLGALAFVCVAATPLMRAIFGEEFVPAARALPVLGGAFVFICFGYLLANMLLVLELVRKQVIVGLVGLVVNIVGNVLLVPRYGFMAAAWMTLVTETAVVGCGAYFVLRKLRLPKLDIKPVLRIILAAGALVALLAAAKALGAGLVILVILATLLYPPLLLGLRAIEIDEIRDAALRRPDPGQGV